MALADQLNDLATKAKQVQDRVAAAKQKTKADLEGDVDNATATGLGTALIRCVGIITTPFLLVQAIRLVLVC